MDKRLYDKEIGVGKIIHKLDSGGHASTYLLNIGQKSFALKCVELKDVDLTLGDPCKIDHACSELLSRVCREQEIIRNCNCDFIPTLGPVELQVLKDQSVYWAIFSQEFIPGKTLRAELAQRRLKQDEALALAKSVATAISKLAQHNFVHRDIKPENIIWDKSQDRFVLLDPGIAYDSNDTGLTPTGMAVCTPGYAAPEQLCKLGNNDKLDHRTDMFQLGIVLYEAVTRVKPFSTPLNGWQHRTIHVQPPAPSTINNNISAKFDKLVMRLLAKQRHARFRRPDNLISEIENI